VKNGDHPVTRGSRRKRLEQAEGGGRATPSIDTQETRGGRVEALKDLPLEFRASEKKCGNGKGKRRGISRATRILGPRSLLWSTWGPFQGGGLGRQ